MRSSSEVLGNKVFKFHVRSKGNTIFEKIATSGPPWSSKTPKIASSYPQLSIFIDIIQSSILPLQP